ncbi:hypothetical protein ABEB36_014064 [Hypothenemus hampei]|uniref:Uncharacterized protein n=1 Tax=Hypothenemus hampei TaxID=57062 RepID=A0ABD1E410_HYPHA
MYDAKTRYLRDIYRFPDPKVNFELFQKWITSTGNPELLKLDAEQVYRIKKICHRHLAQKHIFCQTIYY